MKSSPFRSVLAFSSFALVAALLEGCGSTTAPTAGGPSDDAFCSAYKTFVTACPYQGELAGCTSAVVAEVDSECSSFASIFSVAFENAVTSCAPATSCPSNDPFISTCVASIASVTTAAQTKLASDFCGACAATNGQTVSACTAAFWGLDTDAGIPPGPGAVDLQYSDAIVDRIDSTCLTGATACGTFQTCAQSVVTSMTPAAPSACSVSSSGDAGSAGDGG